MSVYVMQYSPSSAIFIMNSLSSILPSSWYVSYLMRYLLHLTLAFVFSFISIQFYVFFLCNPFEECRSIASEIHEKKCRKRMYACGRGIPKIQE